MEKKGDRSNLIMTKEQEEKERKKKGKEEHTDGGKQKVL